MGMIRRWQLVPRDYEGVRARRKEFRAFLIGHRAIVSIGTFELIFGELATNAVRYGVNPMWATATVSDSTVSIDVEDSGDCFDLNCRLADGPRTESGRGLSIVQSLADTLVVTHSTAACHVTATLAF